MQFLARLGLLRNHVLCGICGNSCRINACAQGTDGFRWRCNAHNFAQSIRADFLFYYYFFFYISHLTLSQLVIFCISGPETLRKKKKLHGKPRAANKQSSTGATSSAKSASSTSKQSKPSGAGGGG